MWIFRILYEAVIMAVQQLLANRLRTFLSLLGICIGIFCIISVLSAVDSLKTELKEGFSKLGSNVIYVSKQSWSEPPNRNRFKYRQRPNPDIEDYKALKENLTESGVVSIYKASGAGSVKYQNTSSEGGFIMSVSPEYSEIFDLSINSGRFFNELEFNTASNVAILGHDIAKSLFGSVEPLNKEIKLKGQKYTIVGTFEEEGASLLNPIPYDIMIMIPYQSGKKIINYDSDFIQHFLSIKAEDQARMDALKDEITVALRAERKIRPAKENNFELNELSMLANVLDSVFGVLNLAGIIIGGFAILVGMFSVANIMFVSVQERINLIGVKKALGAPKFVILLEFLIEAIVLCLFGGVIGLLLVFLVMKGITQFADFEMFLSLGNIVTGLLISIAIGVLSGIIPAYRASSLDPVEAMRK